MPILIEQKEEKKNTHHYVDFIKFKHSSSFIIVMVDVSIDHQYKYFLAFFQYLNNDILCFCHFILIHIFYFYLLFEATLIGNHHLILFH